MDQSGCVPDILIAYEWLIICICHADISPVSIKGRSLSKVSGTQIFGGISAKLQALTPGNVIVLAKWTAKVATVTSNRKDTASRMKSSERFLFDGVKGKSSNLTVIGGEDLAITAASDTTESHRTFFYITMSETHTTLRHILLLPSSSVLVESLTRKNNSQGAPSPARVEISFFLLHWPGQQGAFCPGVERAAGGPHGAVGWFAG